MPCEDKEPRERKRFYTRQIDTLTIGPGDAITDNAEAFYLMRQRGITNVIVMGVHTNMCVLGRPFSIRQMVYQGQNVLLMRDMTDTMYNPAQRPFVSHFTGTDLIVEHIEKFWCPTITSSDFLGGPEFRFAADQRKHLAVVMAEREYKTNETLPPFALKHLGHYFRVSMIHDNPEDRNDVPGLDALESADILLISVRRRTLPETQLAAIRTFIASGKPVVGIRTASHPFHVRNKKPAEGLAEWPEFDQQVLGGNYTGHHGNKLKCVVRALPAAVEHPVLVGVKSDEFPVFGSLYLASPLAEGARPLMMGRAETIDKPEPVAWTHTTPAGGRVFYTSLGHPEDFGVPDFERLLRNGIFWAAGLSTEAAAAATGCCGAGEAVSINE